MSFERIGFIAPSTCLPLCEKPSLRKTAGLLRKTLGVKEVYFSPHLFSSDEEIDHVTAPAEARAEVFKRLGEHDQARMDLEVATRIQQKRGQSQLESQGMMFQVPDP
jgi:hypothetical protein